jgi:endonuclease III
VRQTIPHINDLLKKLEKFYGPQEPTWPTEPYEFLLWWYCAYPASDAACTKGWERLKKGVGIEPENLLRATPAKLAGALKGTGMFPELRAQRLKEVAKRVEDEFGGDLRAALSGTLVEVRKMLKTFHGIADPGADRILLFAGIAPIAAVPSNCVHVFGRIFRGEEGKNYAAEYRDAQRVVAAEVPETKDARSRAYLLFKRHGQEICKRTNPKCVECPIRANCEYFART